MCKVILIKALGSSRFGKLSGNKINRKQASQEFSDASSSIYVDF